MICISSMSYFYTTPFLEQHRYSILQFLFVHISPHIYICLRGEPEKT